MTYSSRPWRLEFATLLIALALSPRFLSAERVIEFDKAVLSEEFFSEGACAADLDGDGHADVISGPYWYAGPEYRERLAFTTARRYPIRGYSDYFFCFSQDLNGDGRVDILTIPMPGGLARWFENPGGEVRESGAWKSHVAFEGVDNESPAWVDLTGDGRPELVCNHDGRFGYAEPDWTKPTAPWRFVPVTPKRGYGRFTHGLGVGDVDGDGRLDLLETNGWWRQTGAKGELFEFHAQRFAQSGGAQMFAYDFDGDGDNDVATTLNAHGYGFSWFEQLRDGAKISFVEHRILEPNGQPNEYGVRVSQMHAVDVVDIDGDGVKDIVTGKRFWAHGGGDPGSQQLVVTYCFQTRRTKDGVRFVPWLLDERSGVGTQVTVTDMNGDERPDVVVGSKMGTYVLENRSRSVTPEEFARVVPRERRGPVHRQGTELFHSHVRETEALTPEDELSSFVVPEGFRVDLVASEPDIAKPMNLAFDARGRLWVTSSEEYPYAAPSDRRGKDTIKILEDRDDDGRADRITTFADGLNIPMGLYPYRDGVVCFSIPNVWFLRDTDGDDRVDVRERLYGPFGYERDTHGMVNAFRRGLDGWLYACHGFNNQTSVAGDDGHRIDMRSGNTFRLRLDGSRVEHFTHGQVNPFGLTFDQFGDWLSADCHTKPISLLIEGGYHDQFGSIHNGVGNTPNVMNHTHGSTAIAGIALGEATAFPGVYRTSTFGGNVTTCRINRNSLHRHGGSLRAQEEPDFLVSSDPWFRPVDIRVGPDGALYVADFYNRIIGHYEVALDHPGRDRRSGRIWKVSYAGSGSRRDVSSEFVDGFASREQPSVPREDSVEALVAALGSPLATRATRAVDELVDRFGDAAKAPLRAALSGASELARPRILWSLHRLDGLEAADLETAIAHEAESVRVHAFRILAADPRTNGAVARFEAKVEGWILRGLSDPSALVRRVATTAATKRPRDTYTDALLRLLGSTPKSDVHLRYTLRLAIRDLLVDEGRFARVLASNPSESILDLMADMAVSLKSEPAAEFLVARLIASKGGDLAKVREQIRFAARYATAASLERLVGVARRRFSAKPAVQLELLESIRSGFAARGVERPKSVDAWASALALSYLHVDRKSLGSAWSFFTLGDEPVSKDIAWGPEVRTSADGIGSQSFLSSLFRGEERTGIARSVAFPLPGEFSFFVVGHRGIPEESPSGENIVRLRLVSTGEVLREVFPPRSDIARRVAWKFDALQGEKVYFEVVDGMSGSGFAWLGVGRFDIPGLDLEVSPRARLEQSENPLSWSYLPHSDSPQPENSWVLSTRRRSADGLENTPLYSSFPRGEQRTGIYRSDPFDAREVLRFWVAGHDGFPQEPLGGKNWVRLRDATTHQLLREVPPPRNDTAQIVTWDTRDWKGKPVYVELVDGDTEGAYAWLAVGRFSVPELNPSTMPEDRRIAAGLIRQFEIEKLAPTVRRLLERSMDSETTSALLASLVALSPRAELAATASVVEVAGADDTLRRDAVRAVAERDVAVAAKVLSRAMKVSTAVEQTRLATELASTGTSVDVLLDLVDRGDASPRLLVDAKVAQRLASSSSEDQKRRTAKLTVDLPDENVALDELIATRKRDYLKRGGSLKLGAELFEKSCQACHQVAGKGNRFAPNLDGLGNRGLDRVTEDVLAPNRNVDEAFRSRTWVLTNGSVVTGLLVRKEGTQIIYVDGAGKERTITASSVAQEIPSRLSPMPSDFANVLTEEQFRDLLAYLLSLRSS